MRQIELEEEKRDNRVLENRKAVYKGDGRKRQDELVVDTVRIQNSS